MYVLFIVNLTTEEIEIMKRLILSIAMVLLFAGSALAQTQGPMGFAWDEPDSGGVAVKYIVEVYKDGAFFSTSEVDTNYFEFMADALVPYQIRVAGVDALDNQGEFSVNSDIELLDFGPPSQPGKPYRVTQ